MSESFASYEGAVRALEEKVNTIEVSIRTATASLTTIVLLSLTLD